MKRFLIFGLLSLAATAGFSQKNRGPVYFPSASNWEKQSPGNSGFDSVKLRQAIQFAIANETTNPRSMELNHTRTFGKEPYGEAIGIFADRGEPTGLIIHKGYIVAEWGEPGRVDMTHSVTKSFLSTVVGLAVQKGLITSVTDTVSKYITTVELESKKGFVITPFKTHHNSRLTWEVMLRQTSDWEGTLWGKPDWADRPDQDSTKWHDRKRNEPGTVFEYNDVRVNALALAATVVWKRSLAEVLKQYIMDPIGASATWRWYGYRNSYIILKGMSVQSVSGGGHWGGGMFINAYDMARFGLLTLHKGKWMGKQLIAEDWINRSLTPTAAQTNYGYMNFFLNTDKKEMPSAPATAFVHVGNGRNMVYVDPQHELVVVVRWIENNAADGFIKRLLDAMVDPGKEIN
jgi:CubicO group peptidase (beta-lactamase class C family)